MRKSISKYISKSISKTNSSSSHREEDLRTIAGWLSSSGIDIGQSPKASEVIDGLLLWASFWDSKGIHPADIIEFQPIMIKYVEIKKRDVNLANDIQKKIVKILDDALNDLYMQDDYVKGRLARLKAIIKKSGQEADLLLLSILGFDVSEEEEEEE